MAPFRGTFKGTIVDLQEMDYSKQGNLVRYFKLVDTLGNYIDCCATRQNASSVALANNVEVILYFATGRSAIGSASSALYIMKDGVIVPVAKKMLPPLPKHRIEIQAKFQV